MKFLTVKSIRKQIATFATARHKNKPRQTR